MVWICSAGKRVRWDATAPACFPRRALLFLTPALVPPARAFGRPRTFSVSVPNQAASNFKFTGANGNPESMVSNVVITSRYTALNFVFYNLWDQFHEVSNIYFFLIGILQLVPSISTTQGIPDVYIPLSFILFVSGVRAAVDDYAKHQEDNDRAAKPYLVYDPAHAKSNPRSTVGRRKSMVGGGKAPTGFFWKPSGSLACGDIVMLNQNDVFPADLLVLYSEHAKGHCFVETASLDGETNLKIKEAVLPVNDCLSHFKIPDEIKEESKRQAFAYNGISGACAPLLKLKGRVSYMSPDKDLEKLDGEIEIDYSGFDWSHLEREECTRVRKLHEINPGGKKRIKLRGNNLFLRGTKLKNTAFALGMVLYAGVDTKIRKNNEKEGGLDLKRSAIMEKVNKLLLYMLSLQVFLCFISAIYSGVWHQDNKGAWYLGLSSSAATEAFLRFFTWFIILSQLVPISLVVTSELTKKFQQIFMERDVNMWDDKKGPLKVNYGQISEDLGQVEYVFSDKTGTLTQNKMEFRLAYIGFEAYGSAETDIAKRVKMKEEMAKTGKRPEKVRWTKTVRDLEAKKAAMGEDGIAFPPEVKASMEKLMWSSKDGKTPAGEQARLVRNYLTHMAISNTITPVKDGDDIVYNSSSPDELALCKFAQHLGFRFVGRSGAEGTGVVVVEENRGGKKVKVSYRLQAVLPFDSVRKRVTVIYSDMDRKEVWLMCKGADSCVEPLIKLSSDSKVAAREKELMMHTKKQLTEASNYGLRTLLVSEAKKSFQWWEQRRDEFLRARDMTPADSTRAAKNAMKAARRKVYKKIEMDADMQLLGATAIEDQLQELVPETIEDLLEGGIKVWMLTGDKRETAKNIAMACNLIEPDMIALKVPADLKNAEEFDKFRVNSASALGENRLVEVTGKWAILKEEAKLRKEDTKTLHKLFRLIDADNSGTIDKKELNSILGVLNIPTKQNVFENINTNKDDCISEEEFVDFIANSDINMFKAVEADVDAGLQRLRSIVDLDATPVSMVVEGGGSNSALGIILDAPDTSQLRAKKRTWFERIVHCCKSQVEEEVTMSKKELEAMVLKEKFFELASQCKSVIACRCTPLQKASIVEEMRNRTGSVCLAIGDGGNDEPMIKKANVGCGLVGEEGSAAAQAADYAFAQFRFLHTLIFVHGAWSYERISIMVLYIFYKTAIVAMVMFFFGFFSAFSGQQLFNPWVYTLYNAVFTATPIICVSVMDQGLSADHLENIPKAYRDLISQGQLFGTRIFFRWIMNAVVHTAIIFFTAFWCLETSAISFPNGKTHGLWLTSTTIYVIVVVTVSVRLVFEMRSITWVHHLFFWGSLFIFFFVAIGLNTLETFNPDMYYVMYEMWANPQAWLTSILVIALPLLLDLAIKGLNIELFPSYADLLRERCVLREAYKADKETFKFGMRHTRKQEKEHLKQVTTLRSKLAQASTRSDSTGSKQSQLDTVVNTLLRWQDLTGAILDATEEAGDMLNIDAGAGRAADEKKAT